MSVLSIEQIWIEDDRVNVVAVVEDAKVLWRATYYEPEELGPGLCETSFYFDEDDELPTDDDGWLSYLNNLDLDWQLYND